VTTARLEVFPLMHFFFVLSQLPKLNYVKSVGSLICKKQTDPLDGPPFVVGTLTLLRQYHTDCADRFLELMGQYVRTVICTVASKDKVTELPPDIVNTMVYVEDFITFAKIPRKIVESHIPSYIFDEFRRQAVRA
jgi:WASH complex subunit strumpellin